MVGFLPKNNYAGTSNLFERPPVLMSSLSLLSTSPVIFGEQENFLFHYHPDLGQSFHLLGTRWLFLPDLNGETFHRWSKKISYAFFARLGLLVTSEGRKFTDSDIYILMSLVHLLSFWTLLRRWRTSWREGLLFTQIGLTVLILSINRKLNAIL